MARANPTDSIQVEKLSKTGKILLSRRDQIIDLWKQELRRESERAAELTEPILINTFPVILDNLAEALSPEYPRSTAVEDTTVAEEHGGERARLSKYSLGDVIMEYQLLREAVIKTLSKEVQLTDLELRVINLSFNIAIREGSTAFALVHTEIREQFVATLTHDLRNPLNSISMAAQLLQNEELSSEGHGLLIKILDNSKRMDRMIQDLLDITYVRVGGRLVLNPSEVCIYGVIKEIVNQMTLSHGSKIHLKGEPIKGVWDSEFIKRAIENLVSNAIKYGDSTQPITIEVSSLGPRAIIKVHNEGPPIPISEQETIFQSYRRSHSNKSGKKGWGIGLALVRAVAEAHGGSILIDSAPGRGTTFSIEIPVDSRPYQDAPTMQQ